jgi:hypothetical protein
MIPTPTLRGAEGEAILLAKLQIPKSKLQTNPNIKTQNPKRFEHWYLDEKNQIFLSFVSDLVLGI